MQRLPIPRASELAAVTVTVNGDPSTQFRYRDYLALRVTRGVPDIEGIREADDAPVEVGGVQGLAPVDFVDGGYLGLIGVQPVLGRVISPSDEREGNRVVVVSDAVWAEFFARDRAALGQRLSIRGIPFTVIGVMPASFHGVLFNWRFGMAVTHSASTALGVSDDRDYVQIVTRVEPGSARVAVSSALDATLHACCLAAVKEPAKRKASLVDASRGIPFGKMDFRDDYRLLLWLLMGGALLVLLVACSNVGSLLLARGASRERELAVRLSIGASRGRVIRQLLTESALLAALGGAAGLVLAVWATGVLVATLPTGMGSSAALVEFRPKLAIIVFAVGMSAICVFAFGLGPALRATRHDLVASLKELSGRRGRGRGGSVDRALVVGQVAVTLVLVCGAGLLVATVRNLRTIDPGFASEHLLMVGLETRSTGFERDGIVPLHQEILDRVRHVPGVRSAGMATRIPSFGGRNITSFITVLGQARYDSAEIDITSITPGYFATAGTRLVVGRDFDSRDSPTNARVAVVNQSFARRWFGDKSPLGAEVRLSDFNGGETVSIVGVVQDVRFGDRRTPQDPMVYLPATQTGKWPFFELMIRSTSARRELIPSIESAIKSYARGLRVSRWQTMEEAYDETILRERLAAALGATCAALALGLAMVGLCGVVGFAVVRRTREIGVRMALGAKRSGVVWLVLRSASILVGVGVISGAPLALGAGRALGALLFGIGPMNPVVFVGAAAALFVVGLIASAAPAWRASRVDPVTSLRAD
jgi:predicted permease